MINYRYVLQTFCNANYHYLNYKSISQSVNSQNFFKTIKKNLNKFSSDVREDNREEFKSWAEFNSRGFIRPEYMQCWLINEFGHHGDKLRYEIINSPTAKIHTSYGELTKLRQSVTRPHDVLIKVHAASINPIDIKMCQGYASKLISFAKYPGYSMIGKASLGLVNKEDIQQDFPIILGRDFSGTIVDMGMEASEYFNLGDEVYGTPKVTRDGTLAEYHCTNTQGVALKPATISHIEASALPYAGTVVLQGIQNIKQSLRGKRALILGGTGGTGTIAIQILKAYGCHVSVTCSEASFQLCTYLGTSDCFNYSSETVLDELKSQPKFDLVMDTVGITGPKWAKDFLHSGGTYISLNSPLAKNVENAGVLMGISSTITNYIYQISNTLGINIVYPMFRQNSSSLTEISKLVSDGLLKPVIQEVMPFKDVKEAFDTVEAGHTKGKVVINVSGLAEASEKPKVEKVIHL